jgi:hypothetical protein
MPARYQRCTGHFPQVRPTVAKPSGDHIALGCDHIALGCFVYLFIDRAMRRDDMRRYWMNATYLVATPLAMIG